MTSTESESGYVWPGKFDLNTPRVDVEIFESAKDDLRIQKYPNTCGGGLNEAQNCNIIIISEITKLIHVNSKLLILFRILIN